MERGAPANVTGVPGGERRAVPRRSGSEAQEAAPGNVDAAVARAFACRLDARTLLHHRRPRLPTEERRDRGRLRSIAVRQSNDPTRLRNRRSTGARPSTARVPSDRVRSSGRLRARDRCRSRRFTAAPLFPGRTRARRQARFIARPRPVAVPRSIARPVHPGYGPSPGPGPSPGYRSNPGGERRGPSEARPSGPPPSSQGAAPPARSQPTRRLRRQVRWKRRTVRPIARWSAVVRRGRQAAALGRAMTTPRSPTALPGRLRRRELEVGGWS